MSKPVRTLKLVVNLGCVGYSSWHDQTDTGQVFTPLPRWVSVARKILTLPVPDWEPPATTSGEIDNPTSLEAYDKAHDEPEPGSFQR